LADHPPSGQGQLALEWRVRAQCAGDRGLVLGVSLTHGDEA